MGIDFSPWLASELSGRITKTDLRTGALLRRTSKIVALQDGLAWLEPFIEALALGRSEYLIATPDQVTLWNRRPSVETLRKRIQLLRRQFQDG